MTTTKTRAIAHNGIKYGAIVLAIPTAVHALITLFGLHLTPDQIGALDTLLGLAAAAVMLATGQNASSTVDWGALASQLVSQLLPLVEASATKGAATAVQAALAPSGPETHEAGAASEATPAAATA